MKEKLLYILEVQFAGVYSLQDTILDPIQLNNVFPLDFERIIYAKLTILESVKNAKWGFQGQQLIGNSRALNLLVGLRMFVMLHSMFARWR